MSGDHGLVLVESDFHTATGQAEALRDEHLPIGDGRIVPVEDQVHLRRPGYASTRQARVIQIQPSFESFAIPAPCSGEAVNQLGPEVGVMTRIRSITEVPAVGNRPANASGVWGR
jgi:hypothetical protein